jgi:hypothetical protein
VVCTLPATDPDFPKHDLLAIPNMQSLISSLPRPSNVCYLDQDPCACLQRQGACNEMRQAMAVVDSSSLPPLNDICGTSCATPRTVAERGCVGASLPTANWTAVPTPAADYPTLRQVCEAGLEQVIARTERWLDQAQDYMLQAASGNAGVIAQQLCQERRFDSLGCLGSSDGGAGAACADDPTWTDSFGGTCADHATTNPRVHAGCATDRSSADGRTASQACRVACGGCTPQQTPMAALRNLHNQSCMLADALGRGHSTDSLLSTTDVRPLTYDQYEHTFTVLSNYGAALLSEERAQTVAQDLRHVMGQVSETQAANALDEQNLWQHKVDADNSRMQQYRGQLRTIDGKIQHTLAQMHVDGPALLGSVSSQLSASRAALEHSAGTTPLTADERNILQHRLTTLQSEQADIQAQLSSGGHRRQLGGGGRRQLGGGGVSATIQQLTHKLSSVTQLISVVQQQLSESTSAAPTPPVCQDPTCLTGTPRSTNGCGNDATGQYHSWAMQALQDLCGAG